MKGSDALSWLLFVCLGWVILFVLVFGVWSVLRIGGLV